MKRLLDIAFWQAAAEMRASKAKTCNIKTILGKLMHVYALLPIKNLWLDVCVDDFWEYQLMGIVESDDYPSIMHIQNKKKKRKNSRNLVISGPSTVV